MPSLFWAHLAQVSLNIRPILYLSMLGIDCAIRNLDKRMSFVRMGAPFENTMGADGEAGRECAQAEGGGERTGRERGKRAEGS